jgi:hypothetical protein
MSQNSQNTTKLLAHYCFYYYYNRSKYVMCYDLHLFTIMYNYSILFITFMADITHAHNIVFVMNTMQPYQARCKHDQRQRSMPSCDN